MRSAAAIWWAVLVVFVLGAGQSLDPAFAATPGCAPTRPDSLGPFYEPNAPERDSTRQGLSISGIVRSAKDCHALGGARIEGWSANAHGDYDATHRATQQANSDGHYHYTTDSRDAILVGHRTSMYASPLRDTIRWSLKSILSRHRQPSVWISSLFLNSLPSLCAYSQSTSDWS
jgi:hypothetical protein